MSHDTASRAVAFATLITELDAKIAAQGARITQLETINARLIEATSRLFGLIEDRTLWTAEELAMRDEKIQDEATEKFNAFLSNAADILQLENRVDLVEMALSRRGPVTFVPVPDEGM
jgi:hypothetical protein